jgi:hypothetical protein
VTIKGDLLRTLRGLSVAVPTADLTAAVGGGQPFARQKVELALRRLLTAGIVEKELRLRPRTERRAPRPCRSGMKRQSIAYWRLSRGGPE